MKKLLALPFLLGALTSLSQNKKVTDFPLKTGINASAHSPKLVSQEEKRINVGVSLGVPLTSISGIFPGIGLLVEPQYLIRRRWRAGISFQTSSVMVAHEQDELLYADIGSVLGTVDFLWLRKGEKTAFVGIGGGISSYELYDPGDLTNFESSTHFSALLRAGVEYRHLKTGVEYHLLTGAAPNHLTVYFGIRIGGGWRKE
jgi:hypothetical protein